MEPTESNFATVPLNQQEVIDRAQKDLNFLAALCLGEHMVYLFPAMFLAIWEFLKEKSSLVRAFPQLAIGIPRGFAKTTLIKIYVVYLILFTNKRCIVIVSYIEDHAINIVRDVCDMLTHPNISAIFGMWNINIDRDQQDCKIFAFRGRKIILAALGSKGSIRGLNIGNERPDVMIFEDFQKKEDSENEELSKKLYMSMIGTFMKACSPFGCVFVFVANMYPTSGSILKKLKANKDWMSFIVGAILADGTSLWEELQPIEQLVEEYEKDLRAGVPEVFLAEKLNDETAGIKAGIDITQIPKFPFDEYELPQGRAVIIDPALDNPTSDYNGIGLMGLFDGKPYLELADLGRYTPLELIKRSLIMAAKSGCRLICVENVAYQASLLFWFRQVCSDNGIDGFYFMPINIGGRSKNAKIAEMLKELTKGDIGVKDIPIDEPRCPRPLLINEIIKWQPLKRNNQDTTLDLMTFMKKVVEEHGELMIMDYEQTIQYPGLANAAPREVEENCEF